MAFFSQTFVILIRVFHFLLHYCLFFFIFNFNWLFWTYHWLKLMLRSNSYVKKHVRPLWLWKWYCFSSVFCVFPLFFIFCFLFSIDLFKGIRSEKGNGWPSVPHHPPEICSYLYLFGGHVTFFGNLCTLYCL